MARDVEVEGVTTFNQTPSTSYRYRLQLKDDKLNIWIEDRTSKKQWYKGDMAKHDYVNPVITTTDAPLVDYLKCFQDALDCELDKCNDVERTLEFLPCGALQLSITIQFHFLRSTRVENYFFYLDPVSAERLKKRRDLLEELDRLHQDYRKPFVWLEAATQDANTHKLLWKAVESDDFNVVDGNVTIRRSGLYCITAGVNAARKCVKATLLKNEQCLQRSTCSYINLLSPFYSASMRSVTELDEGDTVSVQCDGVVRGNCHLVVAQLGQ